MASLTDTIAAMRGGKSGPESTLAGAGQQRYPVQYINYTNLEPSDYNFYPIVEIEELADAIELAGGILQPLLVRRKAPGCYEIVAGHRRWNAAKYLVDHGQGKYAMLPCHIQDGDDLVSGISLIVTNSQRDKDAYTRLREVQELEKLLLQLAAGSADDRKKFYQVTGLQEGEKVTARILRKIVAKKAGLSETNVARLQHIDAALQPELKEALEAGQIGITAADELARLDPEKQRQAAEQIKRGEKPSVQTNKQEQEVEKEESENQEEAQLPGQMAIDDYIPDSNQPDTAEEETGTADQTSQDREASVPVEADSVSTDTSVSGTDTELQLAKDYLKLFGNAAASPKEWNIMQRRLAEYFRTVYNRHRNDGLKNN